MENGGEKMYWKKLLTQTRLIEEGGDPQAFAEYPRSPFERDFERIVSSAAFRRLQDKTQVFPLAKSDFVRTRLTHSIEVSTIAKQLGIMCFQNTSSYQHLPIDEDEESTPELIGERVADIQAILSCAGLLHDLGNPPFGHVGEEIIREWFQNNLKNIFPLREDKEPAIFETLNEQHIKDLYKFEGNAQAFRILSKARYHSEINLPFSIISSLIKYPTMSDEIGGGVSRHKMGCYRAEEKVFRDIAVEVGTMNSQGKVVRHPLAYLVEAADDISYLTADLEDAVKSGLVTVDELLNYFYKTYEQLGEKNGETLVHIKYTKDIIDQLDSLNKSENDKTKVMSQWINYLREWLMYVACWRFSVSYDYILSGEYSGDLFYNNNHSLTVELLREAMKEFVFDARVITEPEMSAKVIVDFLLDKFVPALVRYDGYGELTTQDKKVLTLVSSNYLEDYNKAKEVDGIEDEEELLYRRILIATDFVSGMTDGYAKTLYKKMSGLD